MPADPLPEGTDTIVEGAGVGAQDQADADAIDEAAAALTTSAPPTAAASAASDAPAEPVSFTSRVEGLRGQAGDRARDFVATAKDRATSGIDDVVRMIEDAAAEVDGKVGAGYGDYVRRAAGSVSGLSDALKAKDVDTLFADARALVAKSPSVAIGTAAALGFVIARLARAGVAQAGSGGTDAA